MTWVSILRGFSQVKHLFYLFAFKQDKINVLRIAFVTKNSHVSVPIIIPKDGIPVMCSLLVRRMGIVIKL